MNEQQEITDDQLFVFWRIAGIDSPENPGWARHLRYARAIIALSAQPRQAIAPVEVEGLVSRLDRRAAWADVAGYPIAAKDMRDAIQALTQQPAAAAEGEALARRFHALYEQLAPAYGYGTRPETRDFDPTTPNGRLMIAVCTALSAQPRQDEVARDAWQPIDTAPSDRPILLALPVFGVVRGRWKADQYGSPPRPYWTNDRERIHGIVETRRNQPTHWMPLPAPPAMEAAGGES